MFLSCIFFPYYRLTVLESDNEQPRQSTPSDSFKKDLSGAKAMLPTGKKQTAEGSG